MTREEIIKKYDLKLLLLFGSRSRGNARRSSDTDIAFFGNRLNVKEYLDKNYDLKD